VGKIARWVGWLSNGESKIGALDALAQVLRGVLMAFWIIMIVRAIVPIVVAHSVRDAVS